MFWCSFRFSTPSQCTLFESVVSGRWSPRACLEGGGWRVRSASDGERVHLDVARGGDKLRWRGEVVVISLWSRTCWESNDDCRNLTRESLEVCEEDFVFLSFFLSFGIPDER